MVGEVLLVMRALAKDGMTMVCVTHEMDFAHEVADRVIFMDEGRVLERATPQAFFDRPQHPRARQFLSDIRTPFAQAARARKTFPISIVEEICMAFVHVSAEWKQPAETRPSRTGAASFQPAAHAHDHPIAPTQTRFHHARRRRRLG